MLSFRGYLPQIVFDLLTIGIIVDNKLQGLVVVLVQDLGGEEVPSITVLVRDEEGRFHWLGHRHQPVAELVLR